MRQRFSEGGQATPCPHLKLHQGFEFCWYILQEVPADNSFPIFKNGKASTLTICFQAAVAAPCGSKQSGTPGRQEA